MRNHLIFVILLVLRVQAEDFTNQKVNLGKKKCTCDIKLNMQESCKGTAKCDKKCSGSGQVEIEGCTFTLAVKRGKGRISKCSCDVPVTGSGEQPVPMPTSPGSGPQPPVGGAGMQCSCLEASGECPALNCSPGFSKVCPMMGEQCPVDSQQICPNTIPPLPVPGRMINVGEKFDQALLRSAHPAYCQCISDFLLSWMVGGMMPVGMVPVVAGRSAFMDRAMTKIIIKMGKKTCKCQYDINEEDCTQSKMSCDKRCSGKMAGLELEDRKYVMDIMVKKGKVTIGKCKATTTGPTGTGEGSGTGSGNNGGIGSMGGRCVCVSMEVGSPPPTGSGSEPPTGGSGSGQPPLIESVLTRLPDEPSGSWWVGPGQDPDSIDFNCSEYINLIGISLLGSNTTQQVNGQIVLEQGSQILGGVHFGYEASPQTGYFDQPFVVPLTLSPRITYHIKVVYFGNPDAMWSATGGLETISFSAPCGDVFFNFSGGSNGGDFSRGQIPRLIFSC